MPKGGPKRAGSKWSALEMLVKAGKEEDIPTSQIWEIVFSVDPEDYTIPILRLALSGLTFGSIPDRHAGRYSQAAEDRAFACLCLLSKVGQAWCSYPDIGAPAIELIIDRCEGICGWTHWIAVRRKKQYFDNSDSEASDSKIDRQNCIDLARLLVNLIALPGEAIIHAFAATRYFVAALLQLWTTRDKESLFLIELDPQGDPIMNLLLEVVDNTQARDSILEKLNSRKTDAANFAVALTGRAVQARRTILASNPHEEIFWLARNLVVVLQFILNMTTNLASDMLRHSFDKVNYLTEFALLLHAISVALEEGKVPTSAELSMHDVVHLLTRLVTTIDIHYRVPRSWGKLVAGKIDATFTRIILAIPPDGDMKYQKSIGTNLDIFRLFTVYPALLQPILSWGHEDRDPIRVRAANAPETVASTRLKQFMVAGVKRADVYWKFRDSKMFFVCDNSSCKGIKRHTTSLSRQCAGCSSVLYCSSTCQQADWTRHHQHECPEARRDYKAQRLSGTWYSHWSRAYHERLLASDFNDSQSSLSLAKSPEKATDKPFRHPIISYVGGATVSHELVNYKSDGWTYRDGIEFSQEYLLPRLRSLGRKYAAATQMMNMELHLAEGVFPLWPRLHQLHLVALLRKVGSTYEVVYSIPRRGVRSELVPGLR